MPVLIVPLSPRRLLVSWPYRRVPPLNLHPSAAMYVERGTHNAKKISLSIRPTKFQYLFFHILVVVIISLVKTLKRLLY